MSNDDARVVSWPPGEPAPAPLRDARDVAHDILALVDPDYRRCGNDGDLGDHYVKCQEATAIIIADRAARPAVAQLRDLLEEGARLVEEVKGLAFRAWARRVREVIGRTFNCS